MTNKEILKKQILYRSTHRGTKEMDLLLGNFVKANIEILEEPELEDLKKFMDLEDEILKKWFFDKDKNELIQDNKIARMFKKFKL